MTNEPVEAVISCQAALIEALDGQEVFAIEHATANLARALDAIRDSQPLDDAIEIGRVDYALRQAHAARIRVNCLSEWTCQKIDRLQNLRGIQRNVAQSKY